MQHNNEEQVKNFIDNCGLSQYYAIFIEEGFDRLDSLLEITENDLIQMQVKRGHRRLLQRAIANAQGIPSTVPLYIPSELNDLNTITTTTINNPNSNHNTMPTPFIKPHTSSSSLPQYSIQLPPPQSSFSVSCSTSSTPTSVHPSDNSPSAGTMIHSSHTGMSSTEEEPVTSDNVHRLWKRKYQRHAKPDTNAPLKPASAYIMFSNDVRSELKQQNKSFTDLAKIIGDRWKNISPEDKEMYELEAQKTREQYMKKVEEYQKTDMYKQYQKYLSEFKAENEAAVRPVGRPRKNHKKDERSFSTDARQYPTFLLNQEQDNNTT